MNQQITNHHICPFCNRNVKITALPSASEAAHKWAVLKAKIDNEMLRIKGVGMTVAYNKVLHMMKLLEES